MDDRAADAAASAAAEEGLIFSLVEPAEAETAVIVEVPHAGLAVPDRVRDELTVSADVRLRDSDVYVDALCARAPSRGATLLAAHVSRYVVDLNRAPDDVDLETVPDHPDPRGVQPRGVVWRVTSDGMPALRAPLSYARLRDRLERYHTPYHDALAARLAQKRARFGHAILLAAHSMPSVSKVGGTTTRRADVVPGTRGRTTADARVIDLVADHFRAAGLTVRHDDPYRGGWTTGNYGRPDAGWHAIQLELNRALYVDEATSRPKDGDFEAIEALLLELVGKLGALRLRSDER
ncbi:MAG: N-formylglutamate amidohydrolase [Sandaracinaceae bacterium]|nr:N-formylglutamate amidohydrolase [Sandaracinaceae bacterium]